MPDIFFFACCGCGHSLSFKTEQEQTMSQKDKVLAYLQDGNAITPLEALRLFGSLRLGAIIFTLRESGYDIRTTMVQGVNNRYASYHLRERITQGDFFAG